VARISAPGAHIPLEFTLESPIKTQKLKKAENDRPRWPLRPAYAPAHGIIWPRHFPASPGEADP
jgi:hypothetical protein